MSILAQATTGRVVRPPSILVYGPDGVGKTTFAAGAPKPLFLGAEEGTNNLDVTRLKVQTFIDFKEALEELANKSVAHGFETLVIDTADWLESLMGQHVVKTLGKHDYTSIEDFGFGKGRVHVLETWRETLPYLNACRDRGMGIVFLAHSMVKKFEDPSTPQGYERYQLKLQSGAMSDTAALLREYVDTVMFANFDVVVTEDDKRRAFGEGGRVLFTERRPGFDAKNRQNLPFKMEMSWATYAKHAAAGLQGPEDLSGLVAQLPTDIKTAVEQSIKMATGNPAELARIKAKMLLVISQGKEKS